MPPEHLSLVSQCAAFLGLTRSEVLSIAGTGPKRYKSYDIPKRNGGRRVICQPSRELKALQYFFLTQILPNAPVHPAAAAYQKGRSIRDNAEAHRRSRVILKTDFEAFFPSITVDDWARYVAEVFPSWTPEDLSFSAYVMFWGDGGYRPMCLSIGAPTSPMLSNMMMFKFDEAMDKYALENDLVYTRYADDITISSRGFINMNAALQKIQETASSTAIARLRLNERKTYIGSKANRRRVTGLILSNDGLVSLGRERKRLISAMVHRATKGNLTSHERAKLHGLIAFAADAEPSFVSMLGRKYGREVLQSLLAEKPIGEK